MNTGIMLPLSRFVRGFFRVHVSIKTVCLTIVLWLFWAKRCRGVSHTPSMAAKKHVRRGYFVHRYHSVSAHIRAYAIRPYTCSIEIIALLVSVLVPFPPIWGRMRYAPTPVRWWLWLNTVKHDPCSIEILACTMPTIGSDGMFLRSLHKEIRDESTVTTGKSVLLLN